MGKPVKVSGREGAVLRAIGFGLGVPGEDLAERLQMDRTDLADVLNSLIQTGYVEVASMKQTVDTADFGTETFEVNPSFVNDLKEALKRY
jgi:predicted transcriptional regulator